MKRSAPLARRSRLRSGKPPARRTRIRPVNARRRGRAFARNFHSAERVQAVQAMPCALSGQPGPCHNAHIRSRGAGGRWYDVIPLAPEVHRAFDEHRRDTLRAYGVTISELQCRARELARQHKDRYGLPEGVPDVPEDE